MSNQKTTSGILIRIFRDPEMQYGLKEFENIKPDEVLEIFEKEKGKFYLKCFKRNKEILVFNEEKNLSKPEEIIRQLWLHKLTKYYNYPLERIDLEKSINFGREVHEKAADIIVYHKDKKISP